MRWTEVAPSAIRSGSGAVVPLPAKMKNDAANGVTAIAFVGGDGGSVALWTSRDPDQITWEPPQGCVDAGSPTGKVTCNVTEMNPYRPQKAMIPPSIPAGASMGDPTAAWVNV